MKRVEYPWNGQENMIRYYSDDGHEIIENETGTPYGEVIRTYPHEGLTYSEAETYIPDYQLPQEETDIEVEAEEVVEEVTESAYQQALRTIADYELRRGGENNG